jgi:hypothetical protein
MLWLLYKAFYYHAEESLRMMLGTRVLWDVDTVVIGCYRGYDRPWSWLPIIFPLTSILQHFCLKVLFWDNSFLPQLKQKLY